jgi:antitoxin CptB
VTASSPDDNMNSAELGRLRWHCRRGMRELDVLLRRFLEREWPQADAAERDAFRALLERQDPEISALLLGRMEAGDEALARVLERIRQAD